MFAIEALGYLRERIATLRIGLLWLLLVGASALAGALEAVAWPMLALACAWFILVFRLWDDWEDRTLDRHNHPNRQLVRTRHPQIFVTTLWVLASGLAACTAWLAGLHHALALVCVIACLLVLYRWTADRPALRPLRAGLVLAKYPAWVLLLAGPPWSALALAAALMAYMLPVVDEYRETGPHLLPTAGIVTMALIGLWLLAA